MNTTSLSVTDIVKGSIVDTFTEQFAALTPLSVVVALVMGFLVGLIIALVYRRSYRGVLYSPSFAMTLVMMTLITTPVVMCIKSNIALSMGMVGALSIVRFRTAVKDPMDTAYMFWALTMGILLGAGLYVFIKVPSATSYLLVLHCDDSAMPAVQGVLSRIKYRRMRSKTVTQNGTEMTVEVRISERQDLVGQLLGIQGVYDATLVACQSEAGA